LNDKDTTGDKIINSVNSIPIKNYIPKSKLNSRSLNKINSADLNDSKELENNINQVKQD